jgi:hypothetical protein
MKKPPDWLNHDTLSYPQANQSIEKRLRSTLDQIALYSPRNVCGGHISTVCGSLPNVHKSVKEKFNG